jgi:phenylacetate-CoA ligase
VAWSEEVAQRDYLPIDEYRSLQLKRLQSTVQCVYGRLPFYRKALDERTGKPEMIRSLDDLGRLLFATWHDLLDNYPLKRESAALSADSIVI